MSARGNQFVQPFVLVLNARQGQKIERIPEYTVPGGPNNYHCSKGKGCLPRRTRSLTPLVETSWTQGFFPGLLWLLVERERLSPSGGMAGGAYTAEEVTQLARRWQDSFKHLARPAENHDQGFRFQLSFGRCAVSRTRRRFVADAPGRDFVLTGSEDAKKVVVEAAESLIDRYDPRVR